MRFYPWHKVSNRYIRPKIFEIVLINDEIQLFQLRMKYLQREREKEREKVTREREKGHGGEREIVIGPDHLIVIESPQTFTGKPKPFYFNASRDMLQKMGSLDSNIVTHVMLTELFKKDGQITGSKDIWLNEYFSRNMGGYTMEKVLGARGSDIVILTDIDEIPHPRVYESLRAYYAYDSVTGKPKVLIPRIHRLYPRYFMYHFDCLVNRPGELLSGSAVVASRIDQAKSWRAFVHGFLESRSPAREIYSELSDHPTEGEWNYITLLRMFVQSHHPYRAEDVLYPGSWHFSFFGGLRKISRKLMSYSHQNFAKHFQEQGTEAGQNETETETEKATTSGKSLGSLSLLLLLRHYIAIVSLSIYLYLFLSFIHLSFVLPI
jgi:hypothetical protein